MKKIALALAGLLFASVAHAQLVLPGGGSGTGVAGVTSVATSCGVAGGPITTTGTISANSNPNVQSGTNYPFVTGDCGSIVYLSNASNQIPTIAAAGSAGFLKGYSVEACNIGAGTQTITPATSTIGGASTYVLAAGTAAAPKCIGINSDGTNYTLDLTGASSSGASGITVGTTTITSGTTGRLPYDNAGVYGEISGWTTNGTTRLIGSTTALLEFGGASGPTLDYGVTLANNFMFATFGGGFEFAVGSGGPSATTYNFGSFPGANVDVAFSREAAGLVDINTGLGTCSAAASNCRDVKLRNILASGSVPTPSGTCPVTTQVGGNPAGTFVVNGACVAGTVILTFATTAVNGWACDAHDWTTVADLLNQTAASTTTATFAGTMANSDVVGFKCVGY